MNHPLQPLLVWIVKNHTLWSFLNATVIPLANAAVQARKESQIDPTRAILLDAIQQICPDRVVKHGVFQGMQCPPPAATSTLFFPPLLGCYERELQPILEKVCQQHYTEVVDIGCAEGYYAVGFAMRIPTATVYAYDNNAAAIQLCQQAAVLNGVEQRLVTGEFCDANTLITLPFTQKGLIFCDCEGYEKYLFTPEVVQSLVNHDLIIEIHDGVDIYISSQLRQLFESTHDITAIPVLTDIQRANTDDYPELKAYDLATRRVLVAEHRLNSTEWLYITARSSGDRAVTEAVNLPSIAA